MQHMRRSVAAGALLAAALAPLPGEAEIIIGTAAPLTGPAAWTGTFTIEGVGMAVRDLNAAGGVLGQTIETLPVDDFCDPTQAVAAATRLIAAQVQVVVGHVCSGAALPASEIYQENGVIFISPAATNPQLTERGFDTVFRTSGRDDVQGTVAGDLLAERFGDAEIAIVHDGQAYGEGIAEEVRRRLGGLGIKPVLFEEIAPGATGFADLVDRLKAAGVDALFYGGYQNEAGLLVREAKQRLGKIRFVVPDGVSGEDFPLIAGEAAEGVLMSALAEAQSRPTAIEVVERFHSEGYDPLAETLYAYAAVQAWAQAVEEAGTLEASDVSEVLHSAAFDTVLGSIGFNAKGDVTGIDSFDWYIWQGGSYVPLNDADPTD